MKRYGLIIIALLSLYACSSYDDLMDKMIFIPDNKDSNLPAYTEWGYNSFGAKYEQSYFVVANNIVPCSIVYQDGILNFSLNGRVGIEYSSLSNDGKMTLTFSFPTAPMNEYKDLMALHQKEIDLTDTSCKVKMTKDFNTEILTIVSGHLTFKRAQLLRLDDKENRVILSGTFDVQFLRDDQPEVLSDGRFDLGINDLYFSSYSDSDN
ncbi:MAG: hypothetical protein FWF53_12445 [Candidatus Azobacteroides sp.]|nr:hypothetical protein [Candidatus Azobacteroides sp.]